jgi:hypothetical protein
MWLQGVQCFAFTGDSKEMLTVVGESVDVSALVLRLRKKVCSAEIVRWDHVGTGSSDGEEQSQGKKGKKVRDTVA